MQIMIFWYWFKINKFNNIVNGRLNSPKSYYLWIRSSEVIQKNKKNYKCVLIFKTVTVRYTWQLNTDKKRSIEVYLKVQ